MILPLKKLALIKKNLGNILGVGEMLYIQFLYYNPFWVHIRNWNLDPTKLEKKKYGLDNHIWSEFFTQA